MDSPVPGTYRSLAIKGDGNADNTNADLIARLGEVTASPVANTLLDRVKALLTGIVLAAGSAIIGAVRDAGPSWTTVWDVAGVPFNSADASASAASVTDAPTSTQKLVIDDIVVSVGSAISVTFKEETTGTVVFGPLYMAANTTVTIRPRGKGKKLATADKKLQVQTSGAGNVTVSASYHSEA